MESNSTKSKLLQAALHVFVQDPSARMEKIAEAADVSRRTLHRHFSTREDLLYACCEWIMAGFLRDVRRALDMHDDPLLQLRRMFDDDLAKGKQFEFCRRFVVLFERESLQAQYEEMSVLFRGLLGRLKSEGLIDGSLSDDWLEYVWIGIVHGANQALENGAVAPGAVSEMAWQALTNGIIKGDQNRKNRI